MRSLLLSTMLNVLLHKSVCDVDGFVSSVSSVFTCGICTLVVCFGVENIVFLVKFGPW